MSSNKSSKKAEWAANWIGDGFLLAARRLREVQDENPHLFPIVAKFLNIGLRRAYYFARIDRTFRELEVDDDRLTAIGWTKLKLLADYIDGDNSEYLLDIRRNRPFANSRSLSGTKCLSRERDASRFTSHRINTRSFPRR